MTKFCIILVTCGGEKQAKRIAKSLVEDKLAACVNIVPRVDSIFSWKGKVNRQRETLLLIKTRISLFSKLSKKIKKIHDYETPEIIALPVLAGERKYLNWLQGETTSR